MFLSLVSGRALRGLDGCRKDWRRSDRTWKDVTKWRAAGRNFVAARGMRQSRWGRKFRMAVAGERSRRSRSPIRHASSSPRRTWPMTAMGGTGDGRHRHWLAGIRKVHRM